MKCTFTYIGEGIADIKNGDKCIVDTDIKPLPGHIVLVEIAGEMRLRRFHSRFRKRGENAIIKGVVLGIQK